MPKFTKEDFATARDMGLFISGLLGVAHETLMTTAERPTLLILFATMLGLPVILRDGQQKKLPSSDKGDDEPKEDDQ